MRVDIGVISYTEVRNLSFAPEVDVTGSSLPINELTIDIMTEDDISIGQYILIYDDLDNLWAKYWITYAEHADRNTVKVKASSTLLLLERRKLAPAMYSSASASTIISGLFGSLGHSVDSSFSGVTVTGYCPEQTARERLQWVCFVIGAYVRTFFTQDAQVLPIDDTEVIIPAGKTFWKPSVTYDDYITAVRAQVYSYEEREPQSKEKWVEANGHTYVQTAQEVTLSNTDAPPSAPENVVEVKDVTLINPSNVSAVLTYLSKYYFTRGNIALDAINNAEWEPGQRVTVYTDEDALSSGYIASCSFTFGVQARSRIVLESSAYKESAGLTIRYIYNGLPIGKARYFFPVGYTYEVENPYIDMTSGHRYIFRPLEAAARGVMTASNQVVDEDYAIALERNGGDLRIVSVDEVTVSESTSGGATIRTAVIA